jgi:hypothetical protein
MEWLPISLGSLSTTLQRHPAAALAMALVFIALRFLLARRREADDRFSRSPNSWAFAGALLAGVVLLVASGRTGPAPVDVTAAMAADAADAVLRARRESGVELNYGPQSVEKIEAILSSLHARRRLGQLDDRATLNEGYLWGAYVGEVLRAVRGGQWIQTGRTDGPGGKPRFGEDFGLQWGSSGEVSLPIAWCIKRIVNGPEDDVWNKFQVLGLGRTVPEPAVGDRKPQ